MSDLRFEAHGDTARHMEALDSIMGLLEPHVQGLPSHGGSIIVTLTVHEHRASRPMFEARVVILGHGGVYKIAFEGPYPGTRFQGIETTLKGVARLVLTGIYGLSPVHDVVVGTIESFPYNPNPEGTP